jgi:adenylate cyclase
LSTERGPEGRKSGTGHDADEFGPATLGDIGTDQRVEYAVVGDTVNIASRLEAMTRRLGTPVVVSRALVDAVRREPDARLHHLDAFAASETQPISGPIRRSRCLCWI